MRVLAEQDWLSFGREAGVAVAVLRLSGIYGPGRNAFVNLAAGTARRLVKPGQVFNRIHVADIAGALKHLAGHSTAGIFNVTDDLPAPPQDVVAYAAEVMGVEPPPEIPFETAQLSPMARSFYGENKRVSNAAIKAGRLSIRLSRLPGGARRHVGRAQLAGRWRNGCGKPDQSVVMAGRRRRVVVIWRAFVNERVTLGAQISRPISMRGARRIGDRMMSRIGTFGRIAAVLVTVLAAISASTDA